MTADVEYAFDVSTVTAQDAMSYTQSFISTEGYDEPDTIKNWEEHDIMVAIGLGVLEDSCPFARGDHVIAMRRRSPSGRLSKEQMVKFAKLYKVSVSRLYSNATTSENFPPTNRPVGDKVGYSHLEALNGMTDEHKELLVNLTDEESWTVEQLQEAIIPYKKWKEIGEAEEPEFTAAIDQTMPENNLSGLNQEAPEAEPKDDDEYEAKAERLAGNAEAYSWSGEEPLEDRQGFPMAFEPIAAAEQMYALFKMGKISEGWVSTFRYQLSKLFD